MSEGTSKRTMILLIVNDPNYYCLSSKVLKVCRNVNTSV
jgi:hypothetical protein